MVERFVAVARLKQRIQRLAGRHGYRIVPKERDAITLKRWLAEQQIFTIIDVGASIGTTVAEWLETYPRATIHAIEPLPSSYGALIRVASQFPGRVSTYNFAVGSREGSVEFSVHSEHDSSSSLLARTEYSAQALPQTRVEEVIEVKLTTLNALFADIAPSMTRDILVKLDVQGVETDVISGGGEFLKRVKFVYTEISLAPVYVGQSDFNAVHAVLTKCGFELKGFVEQFHIPDGTPIYADVLYENKALRG